MLLAWFGEVPTFHDAEIISLSLSRTGASEVEIHGWIVTDGVDPNGYDRPCRFRRRRIDNRW
ncbi:hypothetical protein LPU83_pLPU83d_0839 (plasmid) [Rhizobium favelukesii]|uniref:Uncharacterized protein n=1 Tax=Rhizobium favelukesii TaxID=348824 RepID=W6RN83_9HYPH|nr:hypothetical protein LPU83_pLPU83d_0839 [Rhizobium favelukesii]